MVSAPAQNAVSCCLVWRQLSVVRSHELSQINQRDKEEKKVTYLIIPIEKSLTVAFALVPLC